METNPHNSIISIIIPVFNAKDTLHSCVESVIEQDFSSWELLLVDDGSTDGSLDLCRKLADSDTRIKVFAQEHQGVSAARNLALTNARGKYICFVDADDIVTKNYLETLYSYREYHLVVCGYYVDKYHWGQNAILQTEEHRQPTRTYQSFDEKKDLVELFNSGLLHMNWNKLFHLDIIRRYNVFFQNYPINEDYIFVLEYMKHIQSLGVIDKLLYHWKRYEGRLSGVDSVPDNILEIYNRSHLLTREFFDDEKVGDAIMYFSYNMLVHKYLNFMSESIMSKSEGMQLLKSLFQNTLVRKSYEAYSPQTNVELMLYKMEKYGMFRLRYAAHKFLRRWKS